MGGTTSYVVSPPPQRRKKKKKKKKKAPFRNEGTRIEKEGLLHPNALRSDCNDTIVLTGRRLALAEEADPHPLFQGVLMLLFLFVFYVIVRRFSSDSPRKPVRAELRGVKKNPPDRSLRR